MPGAEPDVLWVSGACSLGRSWRSPYPCVDEATLAPVAGAPWFLPVAEPRELVFGSRSGLVPCSSCCAAASWHLLSVCHDANWEGANGSPREERGLNFRVSQVSPEEFRGGSSPRQLPGKGGAHRAVPVTTGAMGPPRAWCSTTISPEDPREYPSVHISKTAS